MTETVSSTRLYLGNLPHEVTKEDIQEHFKEASGKIQDIKLMNGFGFIEYDDPVDARDVVPVYHGTELSGNRLTVQFARGSRQRDFPAPDRTHPHPRRTPHRMQITGLPGDTSWQDLKDFARKSALDVVYSEIGRDRDGKGFVEFESAGDLKIAVDKLDNMDFKGSNVACVADMKKLIFTLRLEQPQPDMPRNDRFRSRSPPPFRNRGYPPQDSYYDRRGPAQPRGYSPPRRDHYRDRRSPPPRDDYYGRGGYRSPPPPRGARGPPLDDPYPPPARGGYGRDDPYGAPPPRRGPYDDPYATNGYGRPRERSPPPPRAYGGYDERAPPPGRYW